LYLNFSS